MVTALTVLDVTRVQSLYQSLVVSKIAPRALLFAGGTAVASYVYGWQSMVSTCAAIALSLGLYAGAKNRPIARRCLAYSLFLLTPFLTSINVINALTGLDPSGAHRYWFGITFALTALAVFVYKGQLSPTVALLDIAQPIRLYSGPLALPGLSGKPINVSVKRILYYGSWLTLGLFFFFGLAPAFTPFFVLKRSLNCLDILAFATAFEFYVYFNFAGISFIAFAILRMFGGAAILNFDTPFAARNIIEYWQRWHISLSQACKTLFFGPLRARIGLGGAVAAVFLASAMWHGTTLNFFIWGCFHATGWLATYFLMKRSALGRIAALAIFPFVVIIGRLMFSELDYDLLLRKLYAVATIEFSEPLMLRELTFTRPDLLLIGFALAVIVGEVTSVRSFRRYRIYRTGWYSIAILVLTALLGAAGIGGVYGTR
jgi:alginate O-acetyltransferase complex protein AlgI